LSLRFSAPPREARVGPAALRSGLRQRGMGFPLRLPGTYASARVARLGAVPGYYRPSRRRRDLDLNRYDYSIRTNDRPEVFLLKKRDGASNSALRINRNQEEPAPSVVEWTGYPACLMRDRTGLRRHGRNTAGHFTRGPRLAPLLRKMGHVRCSRVGVFHRPQSEFRLSRLRSKPAGYLILSWQLLKGWP
jgi:hypothetical protein